MKVVSSPVVAIILAASVLLGGMVVCCGVVGFASFYPVGDLLEFETDAEKELASGVVSYSMKRRISRYTRKHVSERFEKEIITFRQISAEVRDFRTPDGYETRFATKGNYIHRAPEGHPVTMRYIASYRVRDNDLEVASFHGKSFNARKHRDPFWDDWDFE